MVVTTKWRKAGTGENQAAELDAAELIRFNHMKKEYWQPMIDGGSQLKQHNGSEDSARLLIERMRYVAKKKMFNQHEIVDKNIPWEQTAAGKVVQKEHEAWQKALSKFQPSNQWLILTGAGLFVLSSGVTISVLRLVQYFA